MSTCECGGSRRPLTSAAVGDQQHLAVLPAADLLDDVEVLFDLQLAEALGRQLHQLVDQAAGPRGPAQSSLPRFFKVRVLGRS